MLIVRTDHTSLWKLSENKWSVNINTLNESSARLQTVIGHSSFAKAILDRPGVSYTKPKMQASVTSRIIYIRVSNTINVSALEGLYICKIAVAAFIAFVRSLEMWAAGVSRKGK